MTLPSIQDIKDLSGVIITVVIFIGLVIFRREVRKLVDWVIGFRRIAKTKEGYELSKSGPEPQPVEDSPETKSEKTVSQLKDTSEPVAGTSPRPDWFEAFIGKRYDEAIAILEEKAKGTYEICKQIEWRSLIAHVKFEKDERSGIDAFKELIMQHPTSLHPYHWYALSYILKEQRETAISILKDGITKVEKSAVLIGQYAECLRMLGRDAEAVDLLQHALRDNPRIASFYVDLAEIYRSRSDNSSAQHWYREGTVACPRDNSLLAKYAAFLTDMGQDKEALLWYKKLVSLEPENETYRALLGNVYLNLKLNDRALETYLKADELSSQKQGWILGNIGNIYKNQGFYSRGVDFLKRALELDPDSKYAHERLAESMSMQEQEESTEKEILLKIKKQLHAPSENQTADQNK